MSELSALNNRFAAGWSGAADPPRPPSVASTVPMEEDAPPDRQHPAAAAAFSDRIRLELELEELPAVHPRDRRHVPDAPSAGGLALARQREAAANARYEAGFIALQKAYDNIERLRYEWAVAVEFVERFHAGMEVRQQHKRDRIAAGYDEQDERVGQHAAKRAKKAEAEADQREAIRAATRPAAN